MSQAKLLKKAAAYAGVAMFLAFILRAAVLSSGIFQFMPIWLFLGFIIVNVILACVPALRQKKRLKLGVQLVCVGIAVATLLLL